MVSDGSILPLVSRGGFVQSGDISSHRVIGLLFFLIFGFILGKFDFDNDIVSICREGQGEVWGGHVLQPGLGLF